MMCGSWLISLQRNEYLVLRELFSGKHLILLNKIISQRTLAIHFKSDLASSSNVARSDFSYFGSN